MKQQTPIKTRCVTGKVATKEHTYKDGFGIQYHDTEVVRKKNNVYVLNSGGWFTNTTKSRINDNLPRGFNLYQKNKLWYVKTPLCEEIPFFDGIKIGECGEVLNGKTFLKSFNAIKNHNQKTQRAINKYCNGLKKKLGEGALKPSSGDCFYCSMVDENGNTVGGKDHLKQHLKESYFMGSLNYNAIKERGYISPALIVETNAVSSIVDAVKKYLEKRLLRRS